MSLFINNITQLFLLLNCVNTESSEFKIRTIKENTK